MDAQDFLIVEGFYESPLALRQFALQARYANIEITDYPGFASLLAPSAPAIKARFEALLGARIVDDRDRFTWGGFRFITAESGHRAAVHADTASDWSAMIYLTPDAPDSAGTGFYRHRATGLSGPPTDREARALGFADAAQFDDEVIRPEKNDLRRWELVHAVAPRFNRLLLFRGSRRYHAPLGGCGKDQFDARLAHIFFFNVIEPVIASSGTKASGDSLACMQSGVDLLGACMQTCDITDDYDACFLVPCSADHMTSEAMHRLAERALASGKKRRTAAQLSDCGASLQWLLLARAHRTGGLDGCWLVDGWKLIRERGCELNLRGACLRGAQLAGAVLDRCDLSEADLSGADLSRSTLRNSRLAGATLTGATLLSASLAGADLTEADLSRADLRHSDLRNTCCLRTTLRGADLWNAYTWGLDLASAFTTGVDLQRADQLHTLAKANVPKARSAS